MTRKSAGLVVLMTLLAALFVFPAFAQAATVEGTVTVAGVAVDSAEVRVMYWSDQNREWYQEASSNTDLDGTFSVSVDADSEMYFVWATDATHTVDAVSPVFEVSGAEVKGVTLALTKEMQLPASYADVSGGSRADLYTNEDVELWIGSDDWSLYNRVSAGYFQGSGVSTLNYSIDRGPTVVTTQTAADVFGLTVEWTLTADGVHAIKYWAVDRNGNVGTAHTQMIYIDKTAPMTAYDMKTATGQTIMLVGTDSGSGVAGTFWRIGTTGEFKPGNLVSVPATGVSTLEFFSVDKAGNYEAVKSMTIQAKAKLTTPRASTSRPRASRTFYMRGAVTGRPYATGTLRVYKVINGKYRYVSKKSFKASSTGSYRVSFKLRAGKYRFKAFYGANTPTSSNPPARSYYSARSTVR